MTSTSAKRRKSNGPGHSPSRGQVQDDVSAANATMRFLTGSTRTHSWMNATAPSSTTSTTPRTPAVHLNSTQNSSTSPHLNGAVSPPSDLATVSTSATARPAVGTKPGIHQGRIALSPGQLQPGSECLTRSSIPVQNINHPSTTDQNNMVNNQAPTYRHNINQPSTFDQNINQPSTFDQNNMRRRRPSIVDLTSTSGPGLGQTAHVRTVGQQNSPALAQKHVQFLPSPALSSEDLAVTTTPQSAHLEARTGSTPDVPASRPQRPTTTQTVPSLLPTARPTPQQMFHGHPPPRASAHPQAQHPQPRPPPHPRALGSVTQAEQITPLIQACLSRYRAFVVSVGLSPADKFRLNLVRNAIEVGDFSFLLLNQFTSCVRLGVPHKLPRTDPPLDMAGILSLIHI